jgi:hypothetical protein
MAPFSSTTNQAMVVRSRMKMIGGTLENVTPDGVRRRF